MVALLPRAWKQACALLGICFLLYTSFLFSTTYSVNGRVLFQSSRQPSGPHARRPFNHAHNFLDLDENTCKATFPGLTKDIDDMVSLGPFTVKQEPNVRYFHARIQDGQVSPPRQVSYIHCSQTSVLLTGLANRSSTLSMKKAMTGSPVKPHRQALPDPSPILEVLLF